MELINKYLPKYNFGETHSVLINATQEHCYKATMEIDLSESRIINFLFRLRGLQAKAQKLTEFTKKMNFTLLEENPFSGFIYGFGVNNDGIQRINDNEKFIEDENSWFQKVGWSFEFIPVTDKQTEVTTITRVNSPTTKTKRWFSIYWFFIKPFSGLIRKRMLIKLKRDLEGES